MVFLGLGSLWVWDDLGVGSTITQAGVGAIF